MNTASLDALVDVFKDSSDPRDPKGVRHDYHGTLVTDVDGCEPHGRMASSHEYTVVARY